MFLFAVWIIVLDTQAGVRHVPASLVEMARRDGAGPVALHARIILWAALPEILAGVRLGVIRGVEGVVIGRLLVSIVGCGASFELYSRNLLVEEFRALIFSCSPSFWPCRRGVGAVERRIEYHAGVRQ